MSKKNYTLFTARHIENRLDFSYTYNRTKDIQLALGKDNFILKVSRDSKTSFEDIFEDPLFRDAIKKVLTLQFIYYGACCDIKQLRLTINQEEKEVFNRDNSPAGLPLMHILCGNQLITGLSDEWKNPLILQKMLSTVKSRYDRRYAALFALIMSHSKVHESEKFTYLWMSMNGIYGYIKDIALKYADDKAKEWLGKEYAQLKFFTLLMGYKYEFYKIKEDTQKDRVRYKLEAVCQKVSATDLNDFILACRNDDVGNPYVVEIHSIITAEDPDNVSHPYMIMLIWLAYQIRCKYFHGESPVPLLSFQNEHPLPALHILNAMLQEYLDANLIYWFKDKGQEEIIQNKINGCQLNNKKVYQNCSDNGTIEVIV